MGLNDIPIFAMLKSRLGYVNARQKLLSENVANADTPGYVPHDLKSFSFDGAVQRAATGSAAEGLALTDAGHIQSPTAATTAGGAFRGVDDPDSEARIDGNQVVLEEQMMKLTQARIDYEAAVDFYQQSLNLINTAGRSPGKTA